MIGYVLIDIFIGYIYSFRPFILVEFPEEILESGAVAMEIVSAAWVIDENENFFCQWPKKKIRNQLDEWSWNINRCQRKNAQSAPSILNIMQVSFILWKMSIDLN